MSKKNCVVITFDRHGQFDGPPYLATMEEAINDCLQFNINYCGFCGESEQLSEDRGKVVDLMKKNQYKEAWNLWVDLSLVEECSRRMWWYELGKKQNPLLKAARNPNATPEVLLVALKDKDVDVRWAAAYNPNATLEILLLALKDKDMYVREAAKEAMKKNPLLALQVAALQAKAPS